MTIQVKLAVNALMATPASTDNGQSNTFAISRCSVGPKATCDLLLFVVYLLLLLLLHTPMRLRLQLRLQPPFDS